MQNKVTWTMTSSSLEFLLIPVVYQIVKRINLRNYQFSKKFNKITLLKQGPN